MDQNVKFIDFDIVANMEGKPCAELKNKFMRIEFADCYYDIQIDPHKKSSIKIQKQHRLYPNTDQIRIEPVATNSINIY